MDNKVILITGGTGSLGKQLIHTIFDKFSPRRVIVFSRDEFKQSEMRKTHDYDNLRYFIGDVRDKDRLRQVMKDVDVVIHTAALKQVPTLEYNPTEAVKTNIYGTQNVIDICISHRIEKAIFISTDKAVNPINLYGATKMAAEKLWNAANTYNVTKFSSVRYGNVIGSRGSVIPLFQNLEGDTAPVTDPEMTRFWLTLEQAVELVLIAYGNKSIGTFIPLLKSMSMRDLARCFKEKIEVIGVRPGEKTHEALVVPGECAYIVDIDKATVYQANSEYTTGDATCFNSEFRPKFTKEEMLCLIGS